MRRFHLPEAEQINGRAAVRAAACAASAMRRAWLTCRAQMIGFATGYFVDALTGAGLVDQVRIARSVALHRMRDVALSVMRAQTNNLFGKLLMWATFAGVAFIRTTKDLDQYKELLKEVRFTHAALCVAPLLTASRSCNRRPPSMTSSGPPPGRALTAPPRRRSRLV